MLRGRLAGVIDETRTCGENGGVPPRVLFFGRGLVRSRLRGAGTVLAKRVVPSPDVRGIVAIMQSPSDHPRFAAGLDLGSLRRVVVVKALHIGDLLLTVPALRALRHGCPAAEITLIGLPWARDLVARLPYLDKMVPFPGYPGMLEVEFQPAQLEASLAELRAQRYDLAVQLHGNGNAANPFVNEIGARFTAGYYSNPDHRQMLDYALRYRDGEAEVLRCLRLVEGLGCDSRGTALEFPLLPTDWIELEQATGGDVGQWPRPIVAINPGARSPSRRWPVAKFARVAASLWSKGVGSLVLLGAPGEENLARELTECAGVPTVALSGRTSLGALAAMIRSADLLITNDTGTAHLAVALGTSSVVVFGPADIRRWAPLDQVKHRVVRHNVRCQPCLHWECPTDHACLTGIRPEEVVSIAEGLLSC